MTMLNSDEITKQLAKARHDQQWISATRQKFAGDELGKLTETAFRRRKPGEFYVQDRPTEAKAGKTLAALSKSRRAEYFKTILPSLHPHVARAWDLQSCRPYRDSFNSRPFRMPADDAMLAEPRGTWFLSITRDLHEYNGDIVWLAAYAPHLANEFDDPTNLGWLLAAAIDGGGKVGDEVFEVLCASARGDHEIGRMGSHIITALLACSRPEAWEFMGKMLLAAQRQEGLRQSILEAVDQAHPGAFKYMLRLIIDNNLARFAATVRALDVWLGLMWDSASTRIVNSTIERLLACMESPEVRTKALKDKDAETVYLALWATAFEDASEVFAPAAALLADKSPERRFVATHILTQLDLPDATKLLVPMLDDPDMRIAARAAEAFTGYGETDAIEDTLAFEGLKRLLERIPGREIKLQAIVWPWWERTLKADHVAYAMINNIGKNPPLSLAPLLPKMGPYPRSNLAERIGRIEYNHKKHRDSKTGPITEEARSILVGLLGDPSSVVRTSALKGLKGEPVTDDELALHTTLLKRKSSSIRQQILMRLAKLPHGRMLSFAEQLVAAHDLQQRLAGLELLRTLAEAGKHTKRLQELATTYQNAHPHLEQSERAHLDIVIGLPTSGDSGGPAATTAAAATLENGLGLLPEGWKPPLPVLQPRGTQLATPAALAALESLCQLVRKHENTEVEMTHWDEPVKRLLTAGGLPYPKHNDPLEDDIKRLPLADIWRQWLDARTDRDNDGLELLRARTLWSLARDGANKRSIAEAGPAAKRFMANWQAACFIADLLTWLNRMSPDAPESTDFLLDAYEDSLYHMTPAERNKITADRYYDDIPQLQLIEEVRTWKKHCTTHWTPTQSARLYSLTRWAYEEVGRKDSLVPEFDEFIESAAAGQADENDLIDLLLRRPPRKEDRFWRSFTALEQATGFKSQELLKQLPHFLPTVHRVRDRIIEIELTRGEQPIASSDVVRSIKGAGGLNNLLRILEGLGSAHLKRNHSYGPPSRGESLAHLLSVTTPASGETPGVFASSVEQLNLPESRLIELAVFAPQWASHVEHTLGWPGLEESVWWLHAHTRPRQEWQLNEVHETWAAQISRRTPVLPEDLGDGAVDVAWFRACHSELGDERWNKLDKAAKYASTSGGHKRAQLFADALRGSIERKDLNDRIKKRQQDAVRSLGLVPLPPQSSGRKRDDELLARYTALQQFRRESRKFGSQKQASEKRAVEIAMDNLARTAGFADPNRLQWAMEQQAVADLAKGPVTVKASDVEVTLAIDLEGKPQLTIMKKGKSLASIPAALKKNENIKSLKDRASELKKQGSRMRQALEEAMCRGDTFTAGELPGLLEHPVLAPMLSRLLFIGEGIMGYPATEGKARGKVLLGLGGKPEPIKPGETLHIAHPADLFTLGQWHEWQRDCFAAERVQPFKQIFREFYPLTPTERGEGALGAEGTVHTRRYAGHQVNPKQAFALLGKRGWIAAPEDGVTRTFHDARITVSLTFLEAFYTPADVDGLTLEGVRFNRRGSLKPLKLEEVPPRIFSEAMRDLDLVVSVAHRGGVNPEATGSTVEIRQALLRETASLLRLSNITFTPTHAIIKGQLATYSLHLGSAITHIQPGGALFIVPVHSQHRGRIFLPFADDDPRTAEVLSKALLLARDTDIRDPSILQQINTAS